VAPPPNIVTRTSAIAAPAERVWDRAVTPEGINDELRPWLRMTLPRHLREATIESVSLGEPAGRSWILLFGFLPVDWDDLCLVELQPGRRFLERSSMLSMRSWQHEREVVPAGDDACEVSDTLTFELRAPMRWIPGSGALASRTVTFLFRHRHRRLAEWARRA
jgi:hypothetical protein